MIKDAIQSIAAAAKKLFTNWGTLLISLFLYAALLGVIYLFTSTRESSLFQVALSMIVFPFTAIVLFFVIQSLGVSYVRVGVGPIYLLKRAIRDCWRVLAITIPILLLGAGIYSLIGYLEHYALHAFAGDVTGGGEAAFTKPQIALGADIFRFLFLLFALPLLTIHLWISVVREGLKGALKGLGRNILSAFSPRSALVYLLIIAIFGGISYVLLTNRVSFKNEWLELWAVGIKTAAGLIVIFLGWYLAIGALAEMTARRTIGEIEP